MFILGFWCHKQVKRGWLAGVIEPNYQGENWIASPALLPHVAQAEEGMEIHYCDDFFSPPPRAKEWSLRSTGFRFYRKLLDPQLTTETWICSWDSPREDGPNESVVLFVLRNFVKKKKSPSLLFKIRNLGQGMQLNGKAFVWRVQGPGVYKTLARTRPWHV